MLPTPFGSNGALGLNDLPRLIDAQISSGAHGISLLGLGGEAGLLSMDERRMVTDHAIAGVNGQLPVIVGVSSESKTDSAALAEHAVERGAAAVMVAPPATGIESADNLFDFFRAVANAAAGADVMIQDAPQYIGTDVGPAVLQRMAAELPNVKYIKTEALPGCDAITRLRQAFENSDLHVFGGQAGINFLDALEAGASGIIPGCEATRVLVEIWNQHEVKNNKPLARDLFRSILPMLVFEMQTLDQFILCTKQALFRNGLLSSPKARVESQLSLISKRILDRHLMNLADLELRICGLG